MRVRVAELDLTVDFAAGEEMRTEISAKFRIERVQRDAAGGRVRDQPDLDRPGRPVRPHPGHRRLTVRAGSPPVASRACPRCRAGDGGCSRRRSTPVRPRSTPTLQVSRARAGVVRHRPAAVAGDRPGRRVGRHASALAAAFCSFLNARTFCSDSASTTSATERYEPSSAYGPDRLPPAVVPHPELLAEQRGEDARLLVAEAGQRLQPGDQLGGAAGGGPDPGGVPVVARRRPTVASACTRPAIERP